MILREPPNDKPDEIRRLNEAFFRLSSIQDFNTIVKWLKLEKKRLSEAIVKEDVEIDVRRGAARALMDFLNYSDREVAEKTLEKLKK